MEESERVCECKGKAVSEGEERKKEIRREKSFWRTKNPGYYILMNICISLITGYFVNGIKAEIMIFENFDCDLILGDDFHTLILAMHSSVI